MGKRMFVLKSELSAVKAKRNTMDLFTYYKPVLRFPESFRMLSSKMYETSGPCVFVGFVHLSDAYLFATSTKRPADEKWSILEIELIDEDAEVHIMESGTMYLVGSDYHLGLFESHVIKRNKNVIITNSIESEEEKKGEVIPWPTDQEDITLEKLVPSVTED